MQPNQQKAEKAILSDSNYIEVVDIFKTLQGEGPFAGQRAIFIRLAGCNLQCPGCDTDYTSNREKYHVSDIIELIAEKADAPYLIVITGGEPFRQNITTLANTLLEAGYSVQVETNGTLRPSPNFPDDAVIVCSPKGSKINKELIPKLDALKYVLNWASIGSDGLPLKVLESPNCKMVARPPSSFNGPIYLQPMDSHNIAENQRNLAATVKSCLEHGYILNLQIHKIAGVE